VLVVANLTPVPRDGYRVGVPRGGTWEVLGDSDAVEVGGSGYAGDRGEVVAEEVVAHGHPRSVALALPPLAVVFLAPVTA
jgi:1,4-alpha-glucan branching enzyme